MPMNRKHFINLFLSAVLTTLGFSVLLGFGYQQIIQPLIINAVNAADIVIATR